MTGALRGVHATGGAWGGTGGGTVLEAGPRSQGTAWLPPGETPPACVLSPASRPGRTQRGGRVGGAAVVGRQGVEKDQEAFRLRGQE